MIFSSKPTQAYLAAAARAELQISEILSSSFTNPSTELALYSS